VPKKAVQYDIAGAPNILTAIRVHACITIQGPKKIANATRTIAVKQPAVGC